MFRFNHPKEAAKLREKRKVSCMKSPGANSDPGGAGAGAGVGGNLHSGSGSLILCGVQNQKSHSGAWIDSRELVS